MFAWQRWPGAVCQDEDPAIWFPLRYSRTALAEARQVCDLCPIAAECLEYALAEPDLDGIWAGTTPSERKAMRGEELDEWGWRITA